jgi:hypothetical protein
LSGASQVFSLDYCTGVTAGVRVLQAADLSTIHGGALALPPGLPESAATLVVISRGDQPTPGYGFTLTDVQDNEPVQGTARVTVTWRTPPRDAILPQVVTHPCLVVALPTGTLRRIEVIDQHGAIVGSVDLPDRVSP